MMRNAASLTCLFLLLTTVAAVAQTPTQVPLVNPGFEAPYGAVNQAAGVTTITGQVANGWLDNSRTSNATVQYAQDTSNPHGGASSQKIVVVDPGSAEASFVTRADFPVRSGNIYTATVWMRGSPGVVARVLVRNRTTFTNLLESNIDLTANWQQVVASGYVTLNDTAFLSITIPAAATVWVDDASISYTAGTITPTPNLGPIPSSFFGMHVNNFAYNQLWNPGFEPPFGVVGVNNPISGQIAANWQHNNSNALTAGVTAVFSRDTTNPHSGTSSQKIEIRSGASGASTQLVQSVALVAGATYTVSAWFRGDSSVSVRLSLFQGEGGTNLYAQTSVPLTPNWRQASVSGQVLAGDAGISSLRISMSSPGSVWVDDVSVTDAAGQPVSGGVPWPAAGFGTLRIWQEPRTAWTGLEPAKGQWNWGPLDSIVAAAEQRGIDILLTLGQTPGWASPTPDVVTFFGAGATAPPTNIQDWRDYVTAVAQRYRGRIRFYEIWNEPNGSNFYSGTLAQLMTLTQEAYGILKAVDPANTVVSPCAVLTAAFTPASVAYVDRLLAAGMGQYIDVLAVHMYSGNNVPEITASTIATLRLVMAKYKLDNMPLWDSEASSGDDTTPPDVAAKYIARKYLTELAHGTIRHNWYGWDNHATRAFPATAQTDWGLNAAGRAYGAVYGWLVGSTLTQALVDGAGNWQIWLTRLNGGKALVVWNPTAPAQLTLPTTFTALSSQDLAGVAKNFSGSTVNVTDSPVLLTDSVPPPACSFSVTPTSVSVVVTGGSRTLSVVASSSQCNWTATSNAAFVTITSGSTGLGNGTVAINVTANASATTFRTGTLTLAGQTITVTQAGTVSLPPFGSVDTPLQGAANQTGSIVVSGWALDDLEVTAVRILRASVGAEPANSEIFVGNAVFVAGARPDIASANPGYPLKDRAGWGYLLLTNMLPNQGNGPYTLYVYADDRDGHSVLVGTRTITCANATATKPFGGIDTPGQGETVSGMAYVNFGWALTPLPKVIPTDGSTIGVYIDGALVGRPAYNQFRSDIAGLFPGLNNSNGAVGALVLDTTKLTNGIHTIAWNVSDSGGAADGLGSRYFGVQNLASLTGLEVAFGSTKDASSTTGTRSDDPDVASRMHDWPSRLRARVGYDDEASFTVIDPTDPRLTMRLLDRLVLHLADENDTGGEYNGYLRVGTDLRPLPVGSSLDRDTGVFHWQAGLGFFGRFDLVFVRTKASSGDERLAVHVAIEP